MNKKPQPAKVGKKSFRCSKCKRDTEVKKYQSYYHGNIEQKYENKIRGIHGIMLYKDRNYRVFTQCPRCETRDTFWV